VAVNGGTSGGSNWQVPRASTARRAIGKHRPAASHTWQADHRVPRLLGWPTQRLNYLWINNWSGTKQPIFYLDDVSLTRQHAARHRPFERPGTIGAHGGRSFCSVSTPLRGRESGHPSTTWC